MYHVTKETKYRILVENFMNRYRGTGPDAVPQTPGGLAWRDTWGSLRYAGRSLTVNRNIRRLFMQIWITLQVRLLLAPLFAFGIYCTLIS